MYLFCCNKNLCNDFDFDFDSEIVSIVDGSYWFQAIIKTNATMGAYLKREN